MARRIPTTFSTAFPAMATTTKPANACEIPQDSIVGSSACTNQSDTNAVNIPAIASTETARVNDQGCSSNSVEGTSSPIGPPCNEKGILAMKTTNKTSALAMLSVSS